MGYYIELPKNLNKAQQLRNLYGATPATPQYPPPTDKVLMCVVQNGLFDAAAIVSSKGELEAFNDPDDYRLKDWLYLDKAKAIELCPRVERYLKY